MPINFCFGPHVPPVKVPKVGRPRRDRAKIKAGRKAAR